MDFSREHGKSNCNRLNFLRKDKRKFVKANYKDELVDEKWYRCLNGSLVFLAKPACLDNLYSTSFFSFDRQTYKIPNATRKLNFAISSWYIKTQKCVWKAWFVSKRDFVIVWEIFRQWNKFYTFTLFLCIGKRICKNVCDCLWSLVLYMKV